MYLVFSCAPHFMSRVQGPTMPRRIGYSSDKTIAENMAKECGGTFRNINDK